MIKPSILMAALLCALPLVLPSTALSAEGAAAAQAALSVPVLDPTGWENLHYRQLTPNKVEFTPAGVRIKVRASASPLIYPLIAARRVSKVKVRLEVSGALATAPDRKKWDEDSRFRLGLVVSGEKRLSTWSKAASPAWVKRLFSLAPSGGGIDRIVFLMMGRSPARVGDTRRHPSSELIEERIAWSVDAEDGEMELDSVLTSLWSFRPYG